MSQTSTVAVIDYGMGNLRSVSQAVEHAAKDLNLNVVVTNDPAVVRAAQLFDNLFRAFITQKQRMTANKANVTVYTSNLGCLSARSSLKADVAENQHITALNSFETFAHCQHVKNTSAIHSYFELLASL